LCKRYAPFDVTPFSREQHGDSLGYRPSLAFFLVVLRGGLSPKAQHNDADERAHCERGGAFLDWHVDLLG
jgi:hypothetical protein